MKHPDPGNAVLITVSDQWIGIPDPELALVFDEFTQSGKTKTGAGRTGLGLAISREIVTQHGGRIWAANNAAGGGDFMVLLPGDFAGPRHRTRSPARGPASRERLRSEHIQSSLSSSDLQS